MDALTLVDEAQRLALRSLGFRSRFVETSGGPVHYATARGHGDGAPTVVLHGFSAHGAQYRKLLVRLRRRSRLIYAFDAPGHGRSPVPHRGLSFHSLYEGLRDALDVVPQEPVVLIGSSMGGACAVRYVHERPERVASLGLISPAGAPMSQAEARSLRHLLRARTHREGLEFVARLFHRPPAFKHLVAEGVRVCFHRPGLQAMLDGDPTFLTPRMVADIRVPTVLVWGEADRLLPASGLDFFRAHLPQHATIVAPPTFGHCPFLDMPDALTVHLAGLYTSAAQLASAQPRLGGLALEAAGG